MRKNSFLLLMCCLLLLGLLNSGMVEAEQVKELTIANGKSQLVEINNLGRVAVADPEIADVIAISNQEILINGLSPGETTIHIWDEGELKLYKVAITKDHSTTLEKIRQLIKFNTVKIAKINETILLSGQVDNQNQRKRAVEIAEVFGEQVVNQIEVQNSLQVLLSAQIFEIDKSSNQELGIDWYGVRDETGAEVGSGTTVFGEDLPEGAKFGIGSFDRVAKIESRLKALIKDGDAKLLAKPKLMTKSGEEAKFIVGGEIPIVTVDGEGNQTVTWRDYGIKFTIKPQVTSNGKLDTYLRPQVSRLDWANAVDYGDGQLPGIKRSEVNTKVVIPNETTIAIGGLIQNYRSENINKIPLLGDIPLLGALFRSKEYQQDKSELLILVTPKIVRVNEDSKDLMGLGNVYRKKEKLENDLKEPNKDKEQQSKGADK
ncbi:MAG: type II and III secretion system protein family protein [Bacillota bacterium]